MPLSSKRRHQSESESEAADASDKSAPMAAPLDSMKKTTTTTKKTTKKPRMQRETTATHGAHHEDSGRTESAMQTATASHSQPDSDSHAGESVARNGTGKETTSTSQSKKNKFKNMKSKRKGTKRGTAGDGTDTLAATLEDVYYDESEENPQWKTIDIDPAFFAAAARASFAHAGSSSSSSSKKASSSTHSSFSGAGGDDLNFFEGFVGLEELDDCDVVYEDSGDPSLGKVVKIKKVKDMEALRRRKARELREKARKDKSTADGFHVERANDTKASAKQKPEKTKGKQQQQRSKLGASAPTAVSEASADDGEESEDQEGQGDDLEDDLEDEHEMLEEEGDQGADDAADSAEEREADVVANEDHDLEEAPTPSDQNEAAPDMSAWDVFGLSPKIIQGLAAKKFTAPTPIQEQTLPLAIRDYRDIIGAAQTGSGKTLAFGIPILEAILRSREKEDASADGADVKASKKRRPLSALIITPTRELAIQIKDHIVAAAKFTDITVGVIVGGISHEKQRRILKYRPDVIIGTPGRLWEHISEGNEHLTELRYLRHFVLDEADRMVEQGHYQELTSILNMLPLQHAKPEPLPKKPLHARGGRKNREDAPIDVDDEEGASEVNSDNDNLDDNEDDSASVDADADGEDEEDGVDESKGTSEDEDESDVRVKAKQPKQLKPSKQSRQPKADTLVHETIDMEESILEPLKPLEKRQTFVFSATMTLDRETWRKSRKIQNKKKLVDRSPMAAILRQLDIEEHPAIIDLSEKKGTSATLTEARITCTKDEKDMYLYYILKRFPGKTLVFANSIDCIRRVVAIFKLLGLDPLPLHASMQQRQRLKNLDRFTSNEAAVIIATDVAARGLDVPGVQHVVHYQMPRNAETYVHRSGRTARAHREGISISLVSEDDLRNYKNICLSLGKGDDLPTFPVDTQFLAGIKKRLSLAKQIDKVEHHAREAKSKREWFQKAASEADMVLDEDLLSPNSSDNDDDADSGRPKRSQVKGKGKKAFSREEQRLMDLKTQLDRLIQQPLLPRSSSQKFITRSLDPLHGVRLTAAKGEASVMEQSGTSAVKTVRKK